MYLLGLKKDLRDQCFLEDHQQGSAHTPVGDMAYPTCCVCSSEVRTQLLSGIVHLEERD